METERIGKDPKMVGGEPGPAAWIGLDWGDKEHAYVLQEASGEREVGKLAHSAENLHGWLRKIGERLGGRPVVLGIEASRGAVVHVLLQYAWLTIYPVNPVTSARYRTAFQPSGAKDDLPDAEVLLELVRRHADKLRPLEEQEEATVKLRGLVEARRRMVDRRTALLNELTSLLKSYYPQALEVVGRLDSELAVAFLRRWPDLISLKLARPAALRTFFHKHQVRSSDLIEGRLALIQKSVALTTEHARVSVAVLQLNALVDHLEVFLQHIRGFDAEIKAAFAAHPNAPLFRDLPGAGPQMAPRLCAAFGTVASVYPDPASLQRYSGVAPVAKRAAAKSGRIGAGTRQSSCGKPSWSGPARRSVIRSGPRSTTSGSLKRGKDTQPSCAPWPSNGSASCGNAGMTKRPTMKHAILKT
jgi:transposase